MLRITPLSPQAAIRVRDLFPPDGEDRAVFCWADGRRTLVRSRIGDGRRVLDSFTLPRLAPIDRIGFRLDPTGLAEELRQDRQDGPNLLVHPLVLPATLQLGQIVRTSAGGAVQVSLGWAGTARLALGGRQLERVVARLDAQQGALRRVQWLVAGVGEVAVGVPGAPLARWLEAWSGPGGPLLASVPRAWRTAALPGLAAGPSDAPAVDGLA